ncbi:uncharacterized protein TM35_000361820 [Trypanosoma theileri]|uniref:Uncharacterized protein n=1 Tax=Trypanosoma theileri TaxID=67003 RepID=A0A1X0NKM7_9TRYP|nr:uncharacterized protein TM35_000361820 [Trypanosoma theileri]ORC85322.1 hypothetical protein TM35_000361820 [Trypanosoma theileri]
MEGRVCAIFVVVQFLGGSIDILDFFHRAWNAELLRNAAAVPTGCLLRFPLLRLQDPHTPHTTNIGSGVVASLHSSGALRVATSGSIEHALAIADFVHAYVSRRLPAAYTSLGATKSITFFQVVLYPAPSQQEGTHNNNNSNSNSNKKTGKKKQEVEEVDTSENGAKWLRERIAFYTSTSHHHHHTYTTSTSGMGGIMNNNNNNNNNNNSEVYTHWWRYVTDISVAPQQYRRTLRIVCHFKTPPVSHTIPQTINNINNNHNHINDINNNMNNSIQTIERDADAFFFGSELMSVIPMGSVFVAAPHSTGGRKRSRREDEMEMFSHHHPDDNNHEDPSQAVEPNIEEEEEEEEEEEKITTPLKEEKEEKEKEEKERVPMVSLCPLVPKAQLKVEALVYRTGRVFVTADSVEALSFVVEQVLLPLFRKDGTIEFN